MHVPPAEAVAGQPLALDASIERAWQTTVELRYRTAGELAWKSVTFELVDGEHYRAAVPAADVRPPGVEYFIAGGAGMHFASPENPHRVAVPVDAKVIEREAELDRYHRRRARARAAFEWVDFGTRTINGMKSKDSYYRLDVDFSYRLLRFPLHSLRFGYSRLLGDTPLAAGGDEQAGSKSIGWFEVRLRATPLVDFDVRGLVAATKSGFTVGGRLELRIGSENGSHVALGGETLREAGSTFFVRLGWDTVPYVLMAATIELTDLPSAQGDTAIRLLYDVAYPMADGLRVGLRGGYQAREADVGSLTLGANLSLDF